MRKLRIAAGPLVALVVALSSVTYVVTAYVAQLEPDVQMQTSLPLARI
jgi:CHASE1-domain containing sensor protein